MTSEPQCCRKNGRTESPPRHATPFLLLAEEAASRMLIIFRPFPFLLFLFPLLLLLSSHPLPIPPPTSVDSTSGEEWSAWSVCSATCGEGWQSRTRFCVSSSYSTQCSGPLREQRPCNNSAVCPGKPPATTLCSCLALCWTLPHLYKTP